MGFGKGHQNFLKDPNPYTNDKACTSLTGLKTAHLVPRSTATAGGSLYCAPIVFIANITAQSHSMLPVVSPAERGAVVPPCPLAKEGTKKTVVISADRSVGEANLSPSGRPSRLRMG